MALEPFKEACFPNLNISDYHVSSEETPDYNCIAWAAGDSSRWWWPNPLYYWPPEAPLEETLQSFRAVFEAMGFQECGSADLEPAFEKVAIYASDLGEPTHAARQLENGNWTSKLGTWQDIDHTALTSLEGVGWAYGTVRLILQRPRNPS